MKTLKMIIRHAGIHLQSQHSEAKAEDLEFKANLSYIVRPFLKK
jgi:hypothetical protein